MDIISESCLAPSSGNGQPWQFVVINFMLAAAARGLGTCWIGLGTNVRNPEIRWEIGIPEDFRKVAPTL